MKKYNRVEKYKRVEIEEEPMFTRSYIVANRNTYYRVGSYEKLILWFLKNCKYTGKYPDVYDSDFNHLDSFFLFNI